MTFKGHHVVDVQGPPPCLQGLFMGKFRTDSRFIVCMKDTNLSPYIIHVISLQLIFLVW